MFILTKELTVISSLSVILCVLNSIDYLGLLYTFFSFILATDVFIPYYGYMFE